MTLYHGSSKIIKNPALGHSIRTLDFGPGLYTTTNEEQAKDFADKVYERAIRENIIPKGRFISIYTVDFESMSNRLNILSFDTPNEEWFDFVMANRRNLYKGRKYDILFGPVANDTIFRTLISFETGEISKKEAIKRLKVRKLFNQMVFASQKSMEFLNFAGYKEVGNG
ncbi:MAG: DUF3990 domain-containing protein [Treponema sp.]|jgi:hypothetical protein|nr:DUF3990 domain-containing protein [Treponema sp.]